MITATITLPKHGGDLARLFRGENFKHKRASYVVKREKQGINVTIQAEDAVALRATANSVIRVISIYEKARAI